MIITGNPADVAAAYIKARTAIQTLLFKDSTANRSKYVSLPAILKEITPTLIENGLTLMQEPVTNDLGIGVATVLMHTSGGTIEFMPLTIPFGDAKPQTLGSALSYARRYAVMSIFGLAGDDDDGQAAQDSFKSKAKQQDGDDALWDTPAAHSKQPDTVSVDQMNRITELGSAVYGDQFGANAGKLSEWASGGVRKTLAALKVIEGEKLIKSLEKKLKEKQLSESHRSQINGIAA